MADTTAATAADDVIDLTSSTYDEVGEDTSAATVNTKDRKQKARRSRKHTLASTITPDQKRVSRRSSARQEQCDLLKRRSEEGTGAKYYGKKDTDGGDADDDNDDDDDVRVYKKDEYFEVDEILDRRTRKYGSESVGLRHVVEYRKSD